MKLASVRLWLTALAVAAVLIAGGAALKSARDPEPAAPQRSRDATVTVNRRDFVRAIRLSGTVEAVQSMTIATPRLAGPGGNSLVITTLVRSGAAVKKGDLIVEFDRQEQIRNALDRRAELNDLELQIRRRVAQAAAVRARDDSAIKQAESAVSRAELEIVKNEMLPKIQAEKNLHALEQAKATLAELRNTYELKRRAAEADLRIVEIRRGRSENAVRQAETNADRMTIRAPIDGMAVVRSIFKTSSLAEVQEGEEVRPGVPIVDIVDPRAMRVRARVNQADINRLQAGQRVRVGLDAYPELSFDGAVTQISPLGVTSTLSPRVRMYVVLIDVQGTHPNLMPDLTASLDVEIEREANALVVPRDALRKDGERAFVRVQRGQSFQEQEVTVGRVSAHEAVIVSGLEPGAVVARNIPQAGSR